jgi:hypothetical protein
MKFHKLRNRLAAAATIGAAASSIALMLGAGVASASPPSDPPGGAVPAYPHFYNGNVEGIRDTGSDTTFFMVQKIGDLYTGAGLYGCTLDNAATGDTLFNSSDTDSAATEYYYCQSNQNIDTTDTADNWDRTEVTEGVDDVGSGAGQSQLCGASTLSSPLPVDFARSSVPVSVNCTANPEVGTGYAKDGVPIIDFPTVDPATYGASTFTSTETGSTVSYANVNFGEIGEVADGWLPGDNPSGPYHGQAYTSTAGSFSNTDANPTNSTVYGIWCSGTINDWGYLTNLGGSGKQLAIVGVTVANTGPGGDAVLTLPATATTYFPVTSFPTQIVAGNAASGGASSYGGSNEIASGSTVSTNSGSSITLDKPATTTGGPVTVDFTTTTALAEGKGIPYGLPIRTIGVNTSSGTEKIFQGFAGYNASGTNGCASQVPKLTLVATDPNATTDTGDNATAHTALENNASQIGDFDSADFPNDEVDQAVELATSLYFESNGVFNTNPYAGTGYVTNGSSTTNYSGSEVQEDGEKPTTQNLLNNVYPTARTLFNVYQPTSVRASTAGFLNWICDSNNYFQKGKDNSTGLNFDNELTTIIGGNYGFIRLTDESQETPNTTKDTYAALNGTCGVEATGNLSGSTITITDSSGWANGLTAAPSELADGVTVSGPDLPTAPVSTITNITDSGGVTTITLSAPDLEDSTAEQLTFGLPPVLSVPTADAQR